MAQFKRSSSSNIAIITTELDKLARLTVTVTLSNRSLLSSRAAIGDSPVASQFSGSCRGGLEGLGWSLLADLSLVNF